MKGRKPKLRIVDAAFERAGKKPLAVPPPPGCLKEEAGREWRRVAPILTRRGLLSDDTLATLESYCRAVGLCRTYSAMLDSEGHVIQTEKGPVTHPGFKMLMAATREARLFAAELGLTPHRRKAGGEEGGRDDDGWSDLLA